MEAFSYQTLQSSPRRDHTTSHYDIYVSCKR